MSIMAVSKYKAVLDVTPEVGYNPLGKEYKYYKTNFKFWATTGIRVHLHSNRQVLMHCKHLL